VFIGVLLALVAAAESGHTVNGTVALVAIGTLAVAVVLVYLLRE
jgi:hypothetical protein